jgi:hypothetical protein
MLVIVRCPSRCPGAIAIALLLSKPYFEGDCGSAITPKREVEFIEVLSSVQPLKQLFMGSEELSMIAVTAALNRPKRWGGGDRQRALANTSNAADCARPLC